MFVVRCCSEANLTLDGLYESCWDRKGLQIAFLLSESSVERLNQLCGGAFDLFYMPMGFKKPRLHGLMRSSIEESWRSAGNLPRCFTASQGSTDQCSSTDQQFQGAFDGFYWPMGF